MQSHASRRGLIGFLVATAAIALVLQAPSESLAQGSKPPVISLKSFIQEGIWQLDITWHAKDAYEDQDRSAKLDMTATARFILQQSDRRDDWGRWHVEKPQSSNLVYSGLLVNKNDKSRTEYSAAAGNPDAGVIFEVGGRTPGYQLVCSAAYPARIKNPLLGTMDTLVTVLSTDINREPPVFCAGPLPAAGQTIHGSLVFAADVPPFSSPLPRTRLGIQYVLQPVTSLAPLVPPKK